MRILALDLGTLTGWAYFDGTRIESGTQDFSLHRGESPGMRFVRFNAWLSGFLTCLVPGDLLAYEQAHHRGGAATEIAAGFSTRVQEAASLHKLEHASIHSSTLKKFATGKGNAKKPEMMLTARQRWPEQRVETDDQADALWILEWARREFSSRQGAA